MNADAKSLDQIAASLKQAARELTAEQRAKLPDLLWKALSTPVGGLKK